MNKTTQSPILDEEYKQKKRRKQLISWLILIAVVGAIILGVNLVRYFTRTVRINALALPCYAHQDVTIFQDGILYYDGSSIHHVNAAGGIEWSYPVGGGASFAVSDTHLVVWAGTQLFIVDAKGKPSYNESMADPIQFARIGKKYAAIVTGDDLTPTLTVRDMQGAAVDTEVEDYRGMLVLDCGFYGNSDQYLWAMAYDVYNPAIATLMYTYQVGQMNTGEINLGEHLAYQVVYANNLLNVFTTQQMYIYDYKGVQSVDDTMLVYGWKYLDHAMPERGSCQFLLAPTAQTSSGHNITELRVFSNTLDRRYTLPSSCVGAAIEEGRIFAVGSKYLYAGSVSSQRFHANDMNMPNGAQVTEFIGLTNNGYAIVASGDQVYSVTLPR